MIQFMVITIFLFIIGALFILTGKSYDKIEKNKSKEFKKKTYI